MLIDEAPRLNDLTDMPGFKDMVKTLPPLTDEQAAGVPGRRGRASPRPAPHIVASIIKVKLGGMRTRPEKKESSDDLTT